MDKSDGHVTQPVKPEATQVGPHRYRVSEVPADDDLWSLLDDKTWRQLRECTYLALVALKEIDTGLAKTTIRDIDRVLTHGPTISR